MNVSIIMKLVDQVTGPARRMRTAVAVAMKGVEEAKLKADRSFATSANIRQAAEGVSRFARAARAMVMTPLEAAENFQAAMSKVAAVAGASGEELDLMRRQALKLGADTSFSAGQAAQGMFELAKNGFTANEVMAAMPGTLDLAASAGVDVAAAAEVSSSMLRSFRLEADQAGRVANVLSKTANMSAVDLGDMAESMKYAAPIATEFGMSLEQTSAMVGLLGNIGIKGSMTGTALRTSLLNLANPRGQQKKALDFLGIDTVDQKTKQLRPLTDILSELGAKTEKFGQAGKMKFIDAIFGSEGATAMLELQRKGVDIKEFTTLLENSAGAAADTAAIMLDNSRGASEQLSGSWETLMITIGTTLLPAVTALKLALTDVLNVVGDLVQEHPVLTKVVMFATAAVAAFASVLSGALFTASTLFAAKGLLTLIGGWKGVATAIYRFALPAWMRMTVAFIASPIGLLIVGIAALVAAAIWLGFHWDKVTRIWDRFRHASLGVKVALAVVLGPIIAILSPLLLMGFIASKVIDNWDDLAATVDKVTTAVSDFVAQFDNPVLQWLLLGKAGSFDLGSQLKQLGGGMSDVLFGPDAPGRAPGPFVDDLAAYGLEGPWAPAKNTVAAKPTVRPPGAGPKQQVEGLIRVEIEGAAARVKEISARGGIDLDADAGLSMVAP